MALNVLIVDDSPMMRNLVGRVLNLSGLEIGCRLDAGNGAEALKVMSEQSVDLVFVDINMPIMNGEELVREMSRKKDLRNIPVVVISTDGTTARMERMKDLGVMGYLQKPFRPEELRDEVERVMQPIGISPEEINSAVVNSATQVLETMCFSCVVDTANSQLDQQRTPMGVGVQFSGHMNGSLELWASEQFVSSVAQNFLGSTDESDAVLDEKSMLNELANIICGATLTQLYGDGEFQLETPTAVTREPGRSVQGQDIQSDDGNMWVFFEVGPNKWKAKAQSGF